MPNRPLSLIARNDFRGGINTKLFPTLIGENQVVLLQNIRHDVAGELSTVQGHAQIGNTAVASRGRGLFKYVTAAGTEYLAGADSQSTPHIWHISGAGTTFTDGGALTGFTGGNEIYGAQGSDRLFLVDGSARMVSWDGTSIRQSTNNNSDPPSGGDGVVWFLGRLWTWVGRLLYYSRPFFPYTSEAASTFSGGWDRTLQYIDVGQGTGDTITHCEAIRSEEMIIVTSGGIYRLFVPPQNLLGPSLFGVVLEPRPVVQLLSRRYGCTAQNSVVQIGSDVLFLDREARVRSVRRTAEDETAGIEREAVSEAILPTLEAMNRVQMTKVAAGYLRETYYLSYAGSGQSDNSASVTFDSTFQSWGGEHTFAGTRFLRSSWTGLEKMYFTKPENNFKVYEVNSGTSFAGSAITATIRTRREDHGAPWSEKSGKWVTFFFEAGADSDVTVKYSVNGGGFSSLGDGTFDLSGGAGTLPQDLPYFLGSEGVILKAFSLSDASPYRDIQFELSSADLDVSMTFLGYAIFAEVMPPKEAP